MRTIGPIVFVFALAVSLAMLTGAGVPQLWGVDAPDDQGTTTALNDSANSSAAGNKDAVGGSVGKSGGETNIIGLVISSAGAIGRAAANVVLLPLALVELGMPAWAAAPIGLFLQIIVGIGVIEFATGRVWT